MPIPAELIETITRLIELGLRFSAIHNPNEKRINIISCTNPDLIKHKFPEFNIYLSDSTKQKMVERVFYY